MLQAASDEIILNLELKKGGGGRRERDRRMGTICSTAESQAGRKEPSSLSSSKPSVITTSAQKSINNVNQKISESKEHSVVSNSVHDNGNVRPLSTPRPYQRESLDSVTVRHTVDESQQTVCEPEDVKLASLLPLPVYISKRLTGRLHVDERDEELLDKVIRVYHIADDSDSLEERELIQERIYPKLKTFCLERGYELQVTDLHWGGFLDSSRSFRENGILPSQHLRNLLQLDSQTIVVMFLNERYGPYGIQTTLTEETMSSLVDQLTEEEAELIRTWYKKDDNAIPPTYILQTTNSEINKQPGTSPQEQSEISNKWLETENRLREIIWQSTEEEFQKTHLISGLEAELKESILDDMFPIDNAILIRRYFSKLDINFTSSPSLQHFFDIRQGKPDEIAQTKLNNIMDKINNRMKPTNKIELEVPWHEGSFSTPGTQQASYFKQLSSKYEKTLQVAIEKVMEVKVVYDHVRVNMIGAGMEPYLYDEIMQSTKTCQLLVDSTIDRDDLFTSVKSYIIDGHPMASSEHVRPLVIAGKHGSGKSTLVAELATKSCTFRGWTKSICITRHIRTSPGCATADQMVASISSQICFLYDLPYEYAHQPASLYPHAFGQLLNRIPQIIPLVIVIDEVDCVWRPTDMAWLPDELPQHIRIIVTVTTVTKCHETLKNMAWQKEGYIIEVPDMKPEEAVSIVTKELAHYQRQLTKTQYNKVQAAMEANPNPLFAKLVASQVRHWKSYRLEEHTRVGVNMEDCMNDIFNDLQTQYDEEPLGRLCIYLTLLKSGLTDSEMMDLLSTDEGFLSPIFYNSEPNLRRAPDYIWHDIKSYLAPILLTLPNNGLRLTKWRHKILVETVRDIYQPFETATWMKVLDYFEGRWSHGKKIPYPSKDKGIEHLRDRFIKPQPLRFGECYNTRKLQNISECLLQNDMARILKEDYLINRENLTHMLRSCGLYQVLHDYDFYLSFEPNDAEIHFMHDILRQMASVVHQSSDNLWSLLYLRAKAGLLKTKEHPSVHKLVQSLSKKSSLDMCPPFLIPSDLEILNTNHQNKVKAKAFFQDLFRVRDDPNHVVSVAPDKGEVTVWNAHHQVAVRTLSNLQEPKAVKMINSHKAVVLCNRELIIYDLDEGKEEQRLKGVLNIKMPFYGVLDEEHTVVLSRNRMCVNIIKNSTGDLDATFKAGEDRFLDSLILSGNGEWCVCGDQVQKPFPLLVWDLVNRRLVHDLRIAGHEFVTRMAAITTEGHYVVCVCKMSETQMESVNSLTNHHAIFEQPVYKPRYLKEKPREPNFLIVYDLQSGSLFKKWKPDYDTTSVAISSASGYVLSAHDDGSIIVWDLVGGAQRHRLTGHSRGPDSISLSDDGTRAATCDLTCKDCSVRLWDLIQGVCLGTFAAEFGVTCCQLSTDGSVVVIGLRGHRKIVSLWANEEERKKSKLDISIYGDASRNKETFIIVEK